MGTWQNPAAACMMVDRLTLDKLSIEEAVRISEDNGCNSEPVPVQEALSGFTEIIDDQGLPF